MYTSHTPTWVPFAVLAVILLLFVGVAVVMHRRRKTADSKLLSLAHFSVILGSACMVIDVLACAASDLQEINSDYAPSVLQNIRDIVVPIGIDGWMGLWIFAIILFIGDLLLEITLTHSGSRTDDQIQ
jgi:uncharacterized membrane protein